MNSQHFLLPPSADNDLARRIREALGVGPADVVECVTPQFDRTDGRQILWAPKTPEQFDRLKTMDKPMLKRLGLQPWGERHLWLFPWEWYDSIPEGYEVTDINGRTEPFQRGVTDNDKRFGALAYGIVNPCDPDNDGGGDDDE